MIFKKKARSTLVVTSINKPNKAIKKFEILCKKNNIDFIFVSDKKTPLFKYKNLEVLDLKSQIKLPFSYSKYVPFNSYSRKNIGYLYSMYHGANQIFETDDDNYPMKNFFSQDLKKLNISYIKNSGFINIYKYFLKNNLVWPRGLPLSKIISNNEIKSKKINNVKFSFQLVQRLCDGNPDVDAIYRLINKNININFKKNRGFYCNGKSYVPFNSQNTIWNKKIFPLMYLPTYCTMRATDIWRSYISTFIMNKLNLKILFTSPTVFQERNYHNLYNDFKLEIPVYKDSEQIINILNGVKIYKSNKYLLINLINCYQKLIKHKFFDVKEIGLLKKWCADIKKIDNSYIY